MAEIKIERSRIGYNKLSTELRFYKQDLLKTYSKKLNTGNDMKNLKKSILAPVFAVGLLSMGVTACDNAANAPEAEEPVESSSIETQDNADTMATDSNMGTVEEEHDMNNMEDHGMGENAMQDESMTKPEGDSTQPDPNASGAEGEVDTDMLDQDQIIDGTETEEHISTN